VEQPDIHLVGQNLAGADFRNRDLSDHVLFNTDLRGADLYNATISVNCATFHGVKLDDRQVALLLKIISLANITPEWKEGITRLVADVITWKKAQAIDRFLQIHL
jgi:hypothetical protein